MTGVAWVIENSFRPRNSDGEEGRGGSCGDGVSICSRLDQMVGLGFCVQ